MEDFWVNVLSIAIAAISLYVSVWLLFLKPIIDIVGCNAVTGGMVVALVLKIILADPAGRLIRLLGTYLILWIFD